LFVVLDRRLDREFEDREPPAEAESIVNIIRDANLPWRDPELIY